MKKIYFDDISNIKKNFHDKYNGILEYINTGNNNDNHDNNSNINIRKYSNKTNNKLNFEFFKDEKIKNNKFSLMNNDNNNLKPNINNDSKNTY
mgnify:CR=1 FL=1